MCDTADDGVGLTSSVPREVQLRNKGLRTADISPLMPFARQLANSRENRDSHIGFVGYDKTKAGNNVLIAIDREYDLDVPHAVAAALREKGAHVDLLVADMGEPERLFDYTDEVDVIMRREPWDNKPRRWEGMPYIENFALRGGYDLLIHGKGGPIPQTEFRYEQIPWLRAEHFLQRSTTYPLDLHLLINKKTWTRSGNMAVAGARGSPTPRARISPGPTGTNIMTVRATDFSRRRATGICSVIRCRRSSPRKMPPAWSLVPPAISPKPSRK